MASKVKSLNLSLVTNHITNSVKSFQLSKTYVTRLLKIGALNIIYKRIDVPESEFVAKHYETADYMLFKTSSKDQFIRNYHAFVRGFTDAVEKDYLKEMFIYIQEKSTHQVLETYIFKVKYNKCATATATTKPSMVKDATIEFLKIISTIPGEKWSSDAVEISMELKYHDDTPREYEPPYFGPVPQPLSTNLHTDLLSALGLVNTGFHKVSAWGKGQNFLQTPAPSVCQETIEQPTGMKRKCEDDIVDVANKQKRLAKNETNNSAFINITDDSVLENITSVASSTENLSEENVECICKWVLPMKFETVRCFKCYSIVHLACHGYLTLSSVNVASFLCYLCDDNIQAAAPRLNKLMKLRIILYGIHVGKEVPVQLDLASKAEKKYILGQLEKMGIFNSQAKSRSEVDMDMLNKALLTTFNVNNSQYLV